MAAGLYLGSNQIKDVYLGGTKAKKVYLGATQIWSAGGTITAAVAASADDGYGRTSPSADFVTTNGPLIGQISGSNYRGFARFSAVNIPQGATITNASIALSSTSANNLATILSGQAADNPAAPTTASDLLARTTTTSTVSWSIANTAALTTPNISSIIQEIVNRSGWASGNALIIFFTGTGTAFQQTTDKAGVLTVTYS